MERFESPRQMMGYLGLVPSEKSSGEVRKPAGITRAGNGRVRHLLIEASWHQRHRTVPSQKLRERRKDQPNWAVAIAEKADKRLYRKYHRLIHKKKSANVVVTAVAREFVGFIWDMLHTRIELIPDETMPA
jgi:transposase